MSVKKLGIVIYGKCKDRDGFWEEWMDRAKELIVMAGHLPTHGGVSGTSFPEKLRTLRRSERKMREVIANGEPVSGIDIYSLPENYRTCCDSNCWLDMHKGTWAKNEKYLNWAYCEINFEESSKELVEKIRSVLLDFVEMEQCEIFAMDQNQVPYNYVFKGNGEDISKYPTLEILERACG